MEGRGVSESMHAGGWAVDPKEKTPRDPSVSGSYCRNEATEVWHACKNTHTHIAIITYNTCIHKNVTQQVPSCWHWGERIPSFYSDMCFPPAAVELLSAATWFISTWTASAANMLLSKSLYRVSLLFMGFCIDLNNGCESLSMNLCCVCVQYREQLGIRQGLSGCWGSPEKVPLFLPGCKNTQRPGGGLLRLDHGQLLGRPPCTGQYAFACIQIHLSLTSYGWAFCKNISDLLCIHSNTFLSPLQGLKTTGALDLGGASTQISFVSDSDDGSESPDNSVSYRLYGNDYNLYTHSFLCYGKDQAQRLLLAQQTQVSFQLTDCLNQN